MTHFNTHDLLGQHCQRIKNKKIPLFHLFIAADRSSVKIDVGGSWWKTAILENVIYAVMERCTDVQSALKSQRTEQFRATWFCFTNRVMGLGTASRRGVIFRPVLARQRVYRQWEGEV